MNFKPFFVHRCLQNHRGRDLRLPAGFTAHVKPSDSDPRLIEFRISFCSSLDLFCKREGRKEVMQKAPELINPRHLDLELGKAFAKLQGWPKSYDQDVKHHFNYLFKYMV
jgi:hypothetical protein